MREAEQFKIDLLNYVQDRVLDGCNPNIAYMHAASQARGAARILKMLGNDEWIEFDEMANGFWALCFVDQQHTNIRG